MVERIQGEYPFKAEKIALIKKLVDPKEQHVAFARLCEIFSKSWELSNTQGQHLVQNLQTAGFTNYTNEFYDRDMDPDEVDGAWWDIEHNADAQISAMRVAHHLLTTTNIEQRTEMAVSLLNAGHMLGSMACSRSIDTVEKGDNALQVFLKTETRALKLLGEGQLTGERLAVGNPDFNVDEFRFDHRFDYWLIMAAEPGVLNLGDEKDLITLFKRALDIIYLGYGMAMRDVPITEARYWESLGYRAEKKK